MPFGLSLNSKIFHHKKSDPSRPRTYGPNTAQNQIFLIKKCAKTKKRASIGSGVRRREAKKVEHSFENNKLMNEGLRNGQNTNEPKKCLIVLILWAQRLEMNVDEFIQDSIFMFMGKRTGKSKVTREVWQMNRKYLSTYLKISSTL